MRPLVELRKSFAGAGRLDWIGLRPARLGQMRVVTSCTVTADGLADDHGKCGKRAVTLIQAEHLAVIAALCGRSDVQPGLIRRNLVVSGINLSALREHGLRIGDVRLRVTVPCAPCSRMERVLGAGGYNAMRGHGGWCAEVVEPGELSLGAPVQADLC